MAVIKGFVALFIILLSYMIYNYISLLQTNLPIPALNDKDCRRLELDGNGPEDVSYFNEHYLITATSHMHEIWNHYGKSQEEVPSGEIYFIEVATERLIKLKRQNYPSNLKLHSHGIYVRGDQLYILNHAYKFGGERIDVFKIDSSNYEAIYLKSFEFSSEFSGLFNDLTVLDDEEESFFITSWGIFPHTEEGPNKFKHLLGTVLMGGLRVKQTYIYSCSFKSNACQKLENTKGIMNNGITWNKNSQNPVLFVSDSITQAVTSYAIKKEAGSSFHTLIQISEYHFNHMIDNLEFNEKDNAVYASLIGRGDEYFKLSDFLLKHHRLPSVDEFKGHSGTAKLDLNNGEITYLNFNTIIRAGSAAIKQSNKIFYGSWCDSAIVVCDDK